MASLDGNSIRLFGPDDIWTTNKRSGLELVIHELGHVFNYGFNENPSDWVEETIIDPEVSYRLTVLDLGVGKTSQESVEEARADALASCTLNDYYTEEPRS
jgi:hypothetical protein